MKQAHASTKKLLERALDYLINIDHDWDMVIELNGKSYSDITFSAQQVIDCMHKLAIPGDVLLTDRSSFSERKNGKKNEYLSMLNKAKIKRAQRLLDNRGVSINQKLNVTELQEEIMALKTENNTLRRHVNSLNSFIAQAELEANIEDSKPLVGITSGTYSEKYKQLLSNLLQYLIEDGALYATPSKGNVPPALKLDRATGGVIKICNLSDIEDLVKPRAQSNGNIILEVQHEQN
ncbi:hypothetical protein [Sulfuricurvum sp.]|uniref:hypothetical protein n=1 Tax=Sulfuricurvum sp. TaxID=2025608 RepID=UPI00260CF7C5|nr:hypothetical protein [Sulfuricurvum sp.]MDD4950576.1 hypothetical protein [Sulfuricurvum sp.]